MLDSRTVLRKISWRLPPELRRQARLILRDWDFPLRPGGACTLGDEMSEAMLSACVYGLYVGEDVGEETFEAPSGVFPADLDVAVLANGNFDWSEYFDALIDFLVTVVPLIIEIITRFWD